MSKKLLIPLLLLLTVSVTFVAFRTQRNLKPELPMMLSYVSSPRFEHQFTIYGETVDLTRYDRHERFERELTNMSFAHTNTSLIIKRANRIFPLIEPILKEEGVPEDFKYLCCIESNLDIRAVSPVKAAGLWQFMSETGKRYGLQIDSEVDERYNIEKSTRAACRYFKEAYEKYHDWHSVAASYNAGMNGISRRLEEQQQKSALDMLVPDETSRYMFRIMAMKEVMRDPYLYGFVLYSDQLYRPIDTHAITVKTSIPNITEWAKKQGCSYYHLKEFNPWLRANKLTVRAGRTYTILIPDPEQMKYDGSKFPVHCTDWVMDK